MQVMQSHIMMIAFHSNMWAVSIQIQHRWGQELKYEQKYLDISSNAGQLHWKSEVARPSGRMSKFPSCARIQSLLLWPANNPGIQGKAKRIISVNIDLSNHSQEVLNKVCGNTYPKTDTILWLNMRQESNLYINGEPVCARPPNKVVLNNKILSFYFCNLELIFLWFSDFQKN